MTPTKHTSGPSEARATRSTRDPFPRATLILTAYFTAGIFVVLLVMNVLMYWLFIKNLHVEPHEDRVSIIAGDMYFPEDNEDNVEDEDDEGMEEELSEEVRENLISTLFVIDIFVVIAGAGIGYLLARGALRPIRLSYERQKRFVSDAAHELRTPLSVLKAATESSLERERTTPEYIRILKDIFDETHMLTSITDDLLLFSRIERIPSLHTEDVLLSEIVETEARRIEPYADKRKIVLQKTLESNVHVKGDVYLLKRALMNVLKNAVDYNKDGGNVAIALARSGTNAHLTITDTGIGIAPSDLRRVFDPFFKASTSRKAVYGHGSGLGLSIVRQSIEAHGGSIEITSEIGKGTTVNIYLPLLA